MVCARFSPRLPLLTDKASGGPIFPPCCSLPLMELQEQTARAVGRRDWVEMPPGSPDTTA